MQRITLISFAELGDFSWFPAMGKPAAVNEQPEGENKHCVFMKVGPNIKLKFSHMHATAMSDSDDAIRCLNRNWFLYFFCRLFFFLSETIRVS